MKAGLLLEESIQVNRTEGWGDKNNVWNFFV